ncbi:hypothetical protein ACQPZP_36955 [Spirillospora sp. CA-142024]|uniref:hypothetical protein n=1 Tax=Spirillospora sp. CA-142024 TaxID=3240036 RepID=UPI003D8FE98E
MIIADGFTIGYCPGQNAVDRAFRTFFSTNNRSGSPVIDIGLDFPDLRVRDQIEVYRVLPAGDH